MTYFPSSSHICSQHSSSNCVFRKIGSCKAKNSLSLSVYLAAKSKMFENMLATTCLSKTRSTKNINKQLVSVMKFNAEEDIVLD